MAAQVVVVRWGDESRRVAVAADGGVMVDGSAPLRIRPVNGGAEALVEHDGRVSRLFAAADGDTRWVFDRGQVFVFTVEPDGGTRRRAATHQGALAAPMPATVVRIDVRAGDAVTKGQILIVLEAMKMELPVRAPGNATVAAVHCREGELVQPGVSLIDLE